MKNKYIKSPLNYIGGKYKLLPQILPLFPVEHIDTFIDLFSGGGNVGINVDADNIIFNDINTRINGIFRYFQGKYPEDIIEEINKRIDEYKLSKTNQEGFLEFRKAYNENPTPIDLYTLVAYSFNNQFRFNNKFEYNNPFGRNKSYFTPQMQGNLTRFVNKLNTINAIFTDNYFNAIDLSCLTKHSFIYADPPYLITHGSYNETNRTFADWSEKQDKELFAMLDNIDSLGIKFAMSNVTEHKGKTNKPLIDWSSNYKVHNLNYSYSHASYNTNRGASKEVLITNY